MTNMEKLTVLLAVMQLTVSFQEVLTRYQHSYVCLPLSYLIHMSFDFEILLRVIFGKKNQLVNMEYNIPIIYIYIFWAGLFLWIYNPKTGP